MENKKTTFTIYEETESDLILLSQFDSIQEVEKYLNRDKSTIYKNIKNKIQIKLLKTYEYIENQTTNEITTKPIYQNIRVIKDIF